MGRPLKTTKYNGTFWVDSGYPNDGTTDNGFSRSRPGVFGGVNNDYAIAPYVAIEEAQNGTINSTAGITVIWSTSSVFFGSETVSTGASIYANGLVDPIGTVNTINTPASVTCDSAAASTDLITTKGGTAATALVANGPVVFSTNYAGVLTAGTVYYVKAIPSSTSFSVSLTPGGAVIQLQDTTADATATQGHTITLDAGATATVTNSSWTASNPDDGFIIRQKGKKKFLAARRQTINDEFIVAGGSYYIVDPSGTDWEALGAGPDAAAGKIFTAIASGTGLTTNGTVYPVGVCTLTEAQESNLTRNQISVRVDKSSGTDTWASSVTNHFVLDFTDNGDDENMGAKYIASLDGKTNTPDPATGLTTIDLEYWC